MATVYGALTGLFKRTLDFTGSSSLTEYLIGTFGGFFIAYAIVYFFSGDSPVSLFGWCIAMVIALWVLLAVLSLNVRRFRGAGGHWAAFIFLFLSAWVHPAAGVLSSLIIFVVCMSEPVDNNKAVMEEGTEGGGKSRASRKLLINNFCKP